MDQDKKKEFIRTGLITAFFVILALVMLNMVIGNSMDVKPPH